MLCSQKSNAALRYPSKAKVVAPERNNVLIFISRGTKLWQCYCSLYVKGSRFTVTWNIVNKGAVVGLQVHYGTLVSSLQQIKAQYPLQDK